MSLLREHHKLEDIQMRVIDLYGREFDRFRRTTLLKTSSTFTLAQGPLAISFISYFSYTGLENFTFNNALHYTDTVKGKANTTANFGNNSCSKN